MTPIPPNFQTAFVRANLFSRRLIALRRKTVHRTLFLYAVPSHIERIKKRPRKGSFFMAPAVGLEPTTDRLTADCSTTELRWNSGYLFTPKKNKNQVFFCINRIFFGGRYRNRTSIKGFAVLCISHSANRPSKQ